MYSVTYFPIIVVPYLLIIATASSRIAAQEVIGHDDLPIESVKEVQAQLMRVVDSFEVGWDAVYRELDRLQELSHETDVNLAEQWVLFAVQTEGETAGIRALKVGELLGIRGDVVINALSPYLDAENQRLRNLIRQQFNRIDGVAIPEVNSVNLPNYSSYMSYIKSRVETGQPVPKPFAAFVYRKHPGLALRAFHWAFEGPPRNQSEILWAEHVVDDAIWRKENGFVTEFQNVKADAMSALHKLSINRNWWARLYVAEIIKRHPEFRTDSLVERLRADENELVRRAAMEEPEGKGTGRPAPN